MGFGVTLVTFVSGNSMEAEDMNTNYNNLNTITVFTGNASGWCSGGAASLIGGTTVGATVDSSGNVSSTTAAPVSYLGGSPRIVQAQVFTGSGSGTHTHGLSTTPDICCFCANSTSGTVTFTYHNLTSSSVGVSCSSGNSWIGVAIKVS